MCVHQFLKLFFLAPSFLSIESLKSLILQILLVIVTILSLILNIDTATETASVCLTDNGISIAYHQHGQQKDHASFIHSAIKTIVDSSGIQLSMLSAIAVTSGPGSYTGLRVGMATAKGLCYALSKPLILINTLQVMAQAALQTIENRISPSWLCPMIDARRMEVFTAIYDEQLFIIHQPAPLILEANSFDTFLAKNDIYFFGSGSKKWQAIAPKNKTLFVEIQHNAIHLGQLSTMAFNEKQFSDISYSELSYLKETFLIAPKE